MKKRDDRVGEIRYTFYGTPMKIIEYDSAHHILVEFQDEHKIKRTSEWTNFEIGNIRNPYDKSVVGVGYLGNGKYEPSTEGTERKRYHVWSSMLKRCYSESYQKYYNNYNNCKVCDEWHNFQNFAEWYNNNYYECSDSRIELDKDILVKHNNTYCPEKCVFVPRYINTLVDRNRVTRGELPIGVYLKREKYVAQCQLGSLSQTTIGEYDNPIDAFYAYKTVKEKRIKDVANKYKNEIPDKLYQALMNYEVEITD